MRNSFMGKTERQTHTHTQWVHVNTHDNAHIHKLLSAWSLALYVNKQVVDWTSMSAHTHTRTHTRTPQVVE